MKWHQKWDFFQLKWFLIKISGKILFQLGFWRKLKQENALKLQCSHRPNCKNSFPKKEQILWNNSTRKSEKFSKIAAKDNHDKIVFISFSLFSIFLGRPISARIINWTANILISRKASWRNEGMFDLDNFFILDGVDEFRFHYSQSDFVLSLSLLKGRLWHSNFF